VYLREGAESRNVLPIRCRSRKFGVSVCRLCGQNHVRWSPSSLARRQSAREREVDRIRPVSRQRSPQPPGPAGRGTRAVRLIERAVGVLNVRMERAESVGNAPRLSNRPTLESDRHRTERRWGAVVFRTWRDPPIWVTLLVVYAVNGQLGVPPSRENTRIQFSPKSLVSGPPELARSLPQYFAWAATSDWNISGSFGGCIKRSYSASADSQCWCP
jgi:hypothetical protein